MRIHDSQYQWLIFNLSGSTDYGFFHTGGTSGFFKLFIIAFKAFDIRSSFSFENFLKRILITELANSLSGTDTKMMPTLAANVAILHQIVIGNTDMAFRTVGKYIVGNFFANHSFGIAFRQNMISSISYFKNSHNPSYKSSSFLHC